MHKIVLKRTLAGILSIATALSAVPMQMATTVLAAEDYTSESNAEYMYEMLSYLRELGNDFGMPPIMISEGDSVSIDGVQIANTVVKLNKDLVDKQNKVRSEYWLDVLKALFIFTTKRKTVRLSCPTVCNALRLLYNCDFL